MTISTTLQDGFNKIIANAGTQIKLRYFNMTIGSVWDDEATLSQSGADLWTSGLIQPVTDREGTSDSLLLEQGKLINADKKLFLTGSLMTTGSINKFDVQIGSPIGDVYTSIPDGAEVWESNGQKVYKKQYIRRLTGSIV